MNRILITGSSGFLGSQLTKHFSDLGFDVIGGKRATSDLWRLEGYFEKVRFINLDELDVLEKFFQETDIDLIIHTACAYGRTAHSEFDVFKANVELPIRLAHLARRNREPKPVFINTDSFFAKPEFALGYMGSYVLSKRHCWDWLQLFCDNMKVVNMRLEHVYGPQDDRSKFISWLCEEFMAYNGEQRRIELSSCSQLRDFVYIDDVVSAFEKVVLSVKSIRSGQVFEIGTGKPASVREMVEQIEKRFALSGRTAIQPIYNSGRDRPGEIMQSCAEISPLKELGWASKFSLADGVDSLVRACLREK